MAPAAALAVALALAAGLVLAACSAPLPPTPAGSQAAPRDDREVLAGLAAAAKDQRYVAAYTLRTPGQPDRTVTVAMAKDSSWVVSVPGGALSGLANVAIYSSAAGLYQCTLGAAAGYAALRPDLWPIQPGCVPVASLDETTDPRVQHIFTDWIDPLIDRAAALSVAATGRLPGAEGSCFSVQSNSAAMAPPLDPGIYCYLDDGILSAAQVGFGTLLLSGPVDPGVDSLPPPAPIVRGAPLPVIAPPLASEPASSSPL